MEKKKKRRKKKKKKKKEEEKEEEKDEKEEKKKKRRKEQRLGNVEGRVQGVEAPRLALFPSVHNVGRKRKPDTRERTLAILESGVGKREMEGSAIHDGTPRPGAYGS